MALLDLEAVHSGYGRVEVLHGLSLSVPAGATVAVLGPNGVGKTTLLRVISGTLPAWSGTVRFDGRPINRLSPYQRARQGITLIPEGRGIFPGLSVQENLGIATHAAVGADAEWRARRLDDVLKTFPRLAERSLQRAGTLSGGEQQMLALCRAFLANPRLLLLDEISMGLAPIIVEELFANVARLKSEGLTIVLVEQYFTYALELADICYVVSKGQVVFAGEPAELRDSDVLTGSYFGAG
ncbi:MAG TPA: ABC transporter ATP-binding protein [Acidimicrobiia bacterium]|nr:ABC transporter ATP-binding protein [Acidimicrobiia bacterium]